VDRGLVYAWAEIGAISNGSKGVLMMADGTVAISLWRVRSGPKATSHASAAKRVDSATELIWKLVTVAEKRFRRLEAPILLRDAYERSKYRDGRPLPKRRQKAAA